MRSEGAMVRENVLRYSTRPCPSKLNSGGTGSPLSALGDLDPRLIQTAVALFSEYSATDDRKIALLTAMKPFLKPERYAKVDKAVQIARLSRVIRAAFQLFKKSGEEEADV